MRRFLNHFIQLEASAGILLGMATLIALFLANSPLQTYYQQLLHLTLTLGNIPISFLHVINDGFMTLFFFLVSLEIKRELVHGELNSIDSALLPTLAAIGGMVVPALFYLLINHGHSAHTPGWAIPMATDIAFSLAVLSLLNKQIPRSLKVFLTALAIIDDLGAILVIAIFYTQQIAWLYLVLALVCLIGLIALNYYGVGCFVPYVLFGIPLWLFILCSGVHATIAGVLFGLSIPLQTTKKPQQNLSHTLEHRLHPWVAYGILPLFAFANAGLSFTGMHWQTLFHPLPLGIIAGLFLGKQCGILGASWIAVKAKWAKLPYKTNWHHIYGAALICGIGFTMSLFIANLAFSDQQSSSLVRLGVLSGSVLSGIFGYCVLFFNKLDGRAHFIRSP
ncbi:MAG: Na+/H+ antiporter NhaA [Pseudomonadota bacterium]